MWFTATSGSSRPMASALAAATPVSSAPTRPGPCVTATASIESSVQPACSSAWSTIASTASTCMREAISGTTPPYISCSFICDAMGFESILRPSSTTAALVSSQDDSIASMRACPRRISSSARAAATSAYPIITYSSCRIRLRK